MPAEEQNRLPSVRNVFSYFLLLGFADFLGLRRNTALLLAALVFARRSANLLTMCRSKITP